MKRVAILSTQSGDWEALYIDGKLIDEGHHLGEGDTLYLLKQSEAYNFRACDIVVAEINNQDEETVSDEGSFPSHLLNLEGTYV
jgi:hypothetical protein